MEGLKCPSTWSKASVAPTLHSISKYQMTDKRGTLPYLQCRILRILRFVTQRANIYTQYQLLWDGSFVKQIAHLRKLCWFRPTVSCSTDSHPRRWLTTKPGKRDLRHAGELRAGTCRLKFCQTGLTRHEVSQSKQDRRPLDTETSELLLFDLPQSP